MVGRAVGEVGQADDVERGGDPLGDGGLVEVEVAGTERHVVADGREEELVVGILEHQADPAADVLQRGRLDGPAGDADVATGAIEGADEVQHERGLARAVRSEEGDALADADAQVDAVEGRGAVGPGVAQVDDVDRPGSSDGGGVGMPRRRPRPSRGRLALLGRLGRGLVGGPPGAPATGRVLAAGAIVSGVPTFSS